MLKAIYLFVYLHIPFIGQPLFHIFNSMKNDRTEYTSGDKIPKVLCWVSAGGGEWECTSCSLSKCIQRISRMYCVNQSLLIDNQSFL